MIPWIPESDIIERAERLEQMLALRRPDQRRYAWFTIRVGEDRSVIEAARWGKAVQELRKRGAIDHETALVLIFDAWEDLGSLAYPLTEPTPDFRSLAVQFYRELGEPELARFAEVSGAYPAALRPARDAIFGPPDEATLAKPAGEPSARVSQCMTRLREVHGSRTQNVAMSQALATGHVIDEWYEAVQRLHALHELSYPEAVYLLTNFLSMPGLSPCDDDREYQRLEMQRRAAFEAASAESEGALSERMVARQRAVAAMFMRSKGDEQLADLVDREPGRFSVLCLKGHSKFGGGRQIDLKSAEANEPAGNSVGRGLPLDDESIAVRWCVAEIRKLVEEGVKDTAELRMIYKGRAPTNAWFRAIQRVRGDAALDRFEAAFLFDSFLRDGDPTPFDGDEEMRALAREGFAASREASANGKASGRTIFHATKSKIQARVEVLIPTYYEQTGEVELAELYRSDRAGYRKLIGKGERAFRARAKRRRK